MYDRSCASGVSRTKVATMIANELQVVSEGAVRTITLNRPDKHNALSRPLLRALRTAFEAIAAVPDVQCVIVRGAGERYFAAGGDLVDLGGVRTEAETTAMVVECRNVLDAVRDCAVPVVAAVNGDAIGGGAELALACDLRVMAEHASIGYVHGRLAITAAWGGASDLIDLLGRARALRMMATGEMVDAFTALEWGLADLVVPGADLERRTLDFVEPIVQQAPQVLRAVKAQVNAARRGLSRDERRALEMRHIVQTWTHADHWAAVQRQFGDRTDG
jgi:enoyl-CoA hydratase/carnithine racemase